MLVKPEHALQIRIKKWVRECVTAPHCFLAFDRSQRREGANGGSTHLAEKARGIRSGTPDTVLCVDGRAIWIELKAPTTKRGPTENQEDVGDDLVKAGQFWGWCNSVTGYYGLLCQAGVPMASMASLWAENADLRAGVGLKPKPKRAYKPRAPKPTPSRIRAIEKARRETLF